MSEHTNGHQVNILVVDDEATVCESAQRILRRGGFRVEHALSALEALQLLQGGRSYDLVIADLMMPQASGLELLQAIKNRWPELRVLIMTGYASIASAVEATQRGAIGYLPKPFTPDELQTAVQKALVAVDWRQGAIGPPRSEQAPPRLDAEEADEPAVADDNIDVDLPFSAKEVAAYTSRAYVAALGRSDMPVVSQWKSRPKLSVVPRVLVVDDEAVVVNSIRRTLTRKGCAVEEAFSGQQAMAQLAERSFDLVLLDVRLPDANGLDLLPDIKREQPGVPVVVVTGYASIDSAVQAIHQGANDYLAKPFTPDELNAVTSRALGRQAA